MLFSIKTVLQITQIYPIRGVGLHKPEEPAIWMMFEGEKPWNFPLDSLPLVYWKLPGSLNSKQSFRKSNLSLSSGFSDKIIQIIRREYSVFLVFVNYTRGDRDVILSTMLLPPCWRKTSCGSVTSLRRSMLQCWLNCCCVWNYTKFTVCEKPLAEKISDFRILTR